MVSFHRAADIMTGNDVLREERFKLPAGRRLALITNHTGRDR